MLTFISTEDGVGYQNYDSFNLSYQNSIALLASRRLSNRIGASSLEKSGLKNIINSRSAVKNYGVIPFYNYRDFEDIEETFYLRTIFLDDLFVDIDTYDSEQ